ncbi:hypothetical protein Agub_g2298, partial [Astrephomene gubernaculifera]
MVSITADARAIRRDSEPTCSNEHSKLRAFSPRRKWSNHSFSGSVDDSDVDGPPKSEASTSSTLAIGLTSDQVEPWQRFPYLKYGYRRGGSYTQCLLSLFSLHNETVNAWTTLLSVIMGFVLFLDTVSHLRCSWLDFSPFLAAWIGQTLHGPLSCGYHTFMCMSPTIANRWRKLDLTFILVLNTCATYALSYFTFGLTFSLIWTALVGCTAALGIRHVAALQPKQQLDRARILGLIGLTCM